MEREGKKLEELGQEELLEELRRATTYNVGAGHLCGALAAGLARVRG